MDYRNLFGIAALFLSGSVFLHSLNAANAFPQGPNISLGSNPIENLHGMVSISSGGNYANIWTNNTAHDLIITTAMLAENCQLALDNQNIFTYIDSQLFRNRGYAGGSGYDFVGSPFLTGNAAFKIPIGSTLQVYSNSNNVSCYYYIESYYTQP